MSRDGAPGSAGARTRRCGVTGVEQRLGSGGKTGVDSGLVVAARAWRVRGLWGSAAFKERKAEDLGVEAGKESRGCFGRRSRPLRGREGGGGRGRD